MSKSYRCPRCGKITRLNDSGYKTCKVRDFVYCTEENGPAGIGMRGGCQYQMRPMKPYELNWNPLRRSLR